MSFNLDQPTQECCVVVGADAVLLRRAESPEVPIVALVDAASPTQAILAQAAGADVVLPTMDLESRSYDNTPGLDLALCAAGTIAHRRREIARSSRQVSHDLAGAFNVIGLAAEVGASGATPASEALSHITALAREARTDAWKAARSDRWFRRSLTAVDVPRLVRNLPIAGDGVEVVVSTSQRRVFADEQELAEAVVQLVAAARRASATQVRVEVTGDERRVGIVVADDRKSLRSGQLPVGSDLGLAAIAEFVGDLGGSFSVQESDDNAKPAAPWSNTVQLSLPLIDRAAEELTTRVYGIDLATAQADILESVVRHAPLAESLEVIVSAIEQQLPDTACSVLLLRDGRTLHHGAGARLPAAYRNAIDGVAIGRGQGSCGTAAYIGKPVIATDVTTDQNWVDFRHVATQHGLRSCWSTPIVAAAGGEMLGTFAVYKSSAWKPDPAAIKLVKRFTYLAAVAIEHHRLFEALAESESRFRSAFEGASAGLALVSLDGMLLKVNPSLSRLLARPESALLGANLLDLVDPGWRDLIHEAWEVVGSGQGAGKRPLPSIEVPLVNTRDGEQTWVSLGTSKIAAAGELNFYVEVRDVTARRRHLAGQRAREAAEASNRAKNDFLALVSHELRTPLNAILGFAQVLQLADLDLDAEQTADGVEQIVRAGQHLRDLIDELLDLSRIEAGQLSVQIESVNTAAVIREAIDLVRPLAMSRQISLTGSADEAGEHRVLADRRCLRQVLINLLGNAVKYTPVNGRVSVEVFELDSGEIRIIVNDTGHGIAAELIDELFQPFHRLEPESDRRAEGTGLGLALTARLMEEMGGAIGVESTVGVGSQFWVDFPCARPANDVAARQPKPVDQPVLDAVEWCPGVLLYIEDDEASIGVMEAALESRPLIDLRTARSAADGAAQLEAGDIDLVLLDIGLPDRSGWDLLRDIRATYSELPVVVLTAGAQTVSAHVPDHHRLMTKPLDIGDALGVIDRVLSGSPLSDGFGETIDLREQRSEIDGLSHESIEAAVDSRL